MKFKQMTSMALALFLAFSPLIDINNFIFRNQIVYSAEKDLPMLKVLKDFVDSTGVSQLYNFKKDKKFYTDQATKALYPTKDASDAVLKLMQDNNGFLRDQLAKNPESMDLNEMLSTHLTMLENEYLNDMITSNKYLGDKDVQIWLDHGGNRGTYDNTVNNFNAHNINYQSKLLPALKEKLKTLAPKGKEIVDDFGAYKQGQFYNDPKTVINDNSFKALDKLLPMLTDINKMNKLIQLTKDGKMTEEDLKVLTSTEPLPEAAKVQQTAIPLEDVKQATERNRKLLKRYTELIAFMGDKEKTDQLNKVVSSTEESSSQTVNEQNGQTMEVQSAIELSKTKKIDIDGIWDNKKKELTSDYLNLIAWTANFDPFLTNMYDPDITKSLTQTQKELYEKYSDKRLMVFRVKQQDGAIADLKENSRASMSILSLAEFLDKYETDELLLSAKKADKTVLESIGTAANMTVQQHLTNAFNTVTTNVNSTIQDIQNNQTTPSEQAQEFVTDAIINTVADTVNNAVGNNQQQNQNQNNNQQQNQQQEPNLTDSTLKQLENAEINSLQIKVKDIENVFVTPIYVSSGIRAKSILDDSINKVKELADETHEDALGFLNDNEVKPLNKMIDIITSNHTNANYALMHNVLMEKNQLSMAIQEDLNRPLYLDFIGNIITESGYVVVPAAANYTYYMNVAKFPMYNAMFINNYPEVYQSSSSVIDTINKDREKFIYIRKPGGLAEFKRLSSNGELFGDNYTAFQFISRTVVRQDTESHKVINFIEPLQHYFPLYSSIDTVDFGDEKDLVYNNEGLSIMKNTPSGRVRLKLKRISNDGRSLDWDFITASNKWLLEQQDTLNRIIILDIATSVIRSQDVIGPTITYESGQTAIKNNWLNKTVGEKVETLTNMIENNDNNIFFYTPNIRDFQLIQEYAYIFPALIMMLAGIAMAVFIIKILGTSLFRDKPAVKSILLAFFGVIAISVGALIFYNPSLDFIFNIIPNRITSKENNLFIIEQLESEYKNVPNSYFNKTNQNINTKEKVDITLARLTKSEVKEARNIQTNVKSLEDIKYLSEMNSQRINILGSSIYLNGSDLNIKVKDLMEISRITNKLENNYLVMEPYHTGYGRISYYTPYFNIMESLTKNINTYSKAKSTPYSIIQYRKGYKKTTGRVDGFIKSIGFIYPKGFAEYLTEKSDRVSDNKILTDAGFFIDDKIAELQAQAILATMNQDQNQQNLDSNQNPQGQIPEDEKPEDYKKEYTKDDYKKLYQEQVDILAKDIDLNDEEQVKTYETILAGAKLSGLDDAELLRTEAYLNKIMGGNSRDWLGLKEVLLIDIKEDSPFEAQYWDNIKQSLWYPTLQTFDPEHIEREIMPRIYRVNDKTKQFVLRYIKDISTSVSDETLIKMISLYAAMEFNKEFDSLVSSDLQAKYINAEGISNASILKVMLIPSKDLYKGVNSNLIGYIAEKTSGFGLTSSLIYITFLYIRHYIKILIIMMIILAFPYILIYTGVMQKDKKYTAFKGVLAVIAMLMGLTALESLSIKLAILMTNNIGTHITLITLAGISIALTIAYLYILVMIFKDLPNFGYKGIEDMILNIRGLNLDNYSRGLARDLVDEYSNEYYSDMYNTSKGGYSDYNTYDDYSSYSGYGSYGGFSAYNSDQRYDGGLYGSSVEDLYEKDKSMIRQYKSLDTELSKKDVYTESITMPQERTEPDYTDDYSNLFTTIEKTKQEIQESEAQSMQKELRNNKNEEIDLDNLEESLQSRRLGSWGSHPWAPTGIDDNNNFDLNNNNRPTTEDDFF